MRLAIIGAGITGLTAGFRLSQKGHKIIIFEREKFAGGLASGFKEKSWPWHLDLFYHHLFTTSYFAKNLISELGLDDKLFYKKPKTSIFYQGKISQFDSPISLLSFPSLNIKDKLRTALATAYLKFLANWSSLESQTATQYLSGLYGQKAYQILWQPLLESKFGAEAEKIAMSWFWARIKERTQSLGYLEGGFQTLIDKLISKIKENGGRIYLNHPISCFNDLNHNNKFDSFIFTIPTSAFLKIIPNLPEDYKEKFRHLKMIGSINLILVLKEQFLKDNTYWLNINQPSFPFVAVVEHTNYVDKKYYGGNHLLYVGGYYPQDHRFFKMNKEEILKEFLPYLKKINPKFNFQFSIFNFQLASNQYAQPIIPVNYSQIIPPHQTPIPNVFLANMQQVYPWDRGINYAVEQGEKVASMIK